MCSSAQTNTPATGAGHTWQNKSDSTCSYPVSTRTQGICAAAPAPAKAAKPAEAPTYLRLPLFQQVHLRAPKQPQVAHTQPAHSVLLAVSAHLRSTARHDTAHNTRPTQQLSKCNRT